MYDFIKVHVHQCKTFCNQSLKKIHFLWSQKIQSLVLSKLHEEESRKEARRNGGQQESSRMLSWGKYVILSGTSNSLAFGVATVCVCVCIFTLRAIYAGNLSSWGGD
jgi:hypothetical protein